MKKLLLSVLLTVTLSSVIVAQEKIYLDENWEVTSKNNMEYYRESTKKEGNLTLIKDYYKSGVLQMEGVASDATLGNEVFEGKVTWYFPNGKVSSNAEYKNGQYSGISQSFEDTGRVIEDVKYDADGNFTGKIYSYKSADSYAAYNSISEYKNSDITYNISYDDDIKGIRQETFYKNGAETESKFYDGKGKLIGNRTIDSDYKTKGISVEYYYNPMSISKIDKYDKDGTISSTQMFYLNGKPLQETKLSKKDGSQITYDESGKKIGNLTYKLNADYNTVEPFDGQDYSFNYGSPTISTINYYKDGVIVASKAFDEVGVLERETTYKDSYEDKVTYYSPNGTVKSIVTYQEGLPYNGTIYETTSEMTYKDGVLTDAKMFYDDGKTRLDKKLNVAKQLYEAKVFDEEGAVVFSYIKNMNDDLGFTGEVIPFIKGKSAPKVLVKEGQLISGKLMVKSYDGVYEYERKGDWLYSRKFSETGKLISETKETTKTDDDYYSPSVYITEDHLLNY